MHHQVNIHNAKTHLSRLVEDAANGEDIVIAKAGKPVARLTAYQATVPTRKPGIWRGNITIDDEFDTLPTSLAKAFQGQND
ncbi:MAG TPA: type II toxin-antitoxin system Phd/YefM family antitoxin [Gammaproteobacteria bacterium]|nr:type II toxin-antitoxin system Phd/YefM family antitoxin [Gammaproteobacteria bacterium]